MTLPTSTRARNRRRIAAQRLTAAVIAIAILLLCSSINSIIASPIAFVAIAVALWSLAFVAMRRVLHQ